MEDLKNFIIIAVSCITLVIAILLGVTLHKQMGIRYSLDNMKVVADMKNTDDVTTEADINNLNTVNLQFPYRDIIAETTADNCSEIGMDVIGKYFQTLAADESSDYEYSQLKYRSERFISGDRSDFIMEYSFDTSYLEEDAKLLKDYTTDEGTKPLFVTRIHVKVTEDRPYAYELMEIGPSLGEE